MEVEVNIDSGLYSTLPFESESDLSDIITHLSGIDTSVGLFNTQNNSELYLKLLQKFKNKQKDFETTFRMALSDNKSVQAEIAAHDLKSSSGTIGALELQDAAKALEMACKENRDDIEARLKKVISEIKTVLLGLDILDTYSSIEDTSETTDMDKNKIKALAHELLGHLSNYDTRSSHVIHRLLPLIQQTVHAKAFDEVADAVDEFNFELAKQLMERLNF